MSYKTYEVRVYDDGYIAWYKDGKRHREDGPASVKKPVVVIDIRTGFAYLKRKPSNITVIIHDYDVLSREDKNIKKDAAGEEYILTVIK